LCVELGWIECNLDRNHKCRLNGHQNNKVIPQFAVSVIVRDRRTTHAAYFFAASLVVGGKVRVLPSPLLYPVLQLCGVDVDRALVDVAFHNTY
jgi:hypothetical protein